MPSICWCSRPAQAGVIGGSFPDASWSVGGRSHAVEVALACDPFQFVHPTVVKVVVRAKHQLLDSVRNEDLAGTGGRLHTSGDVDGDAGDIAVAS